MGVEELTAHDAITELKRHVEYAKGFAGRVNPHERLVSALVEICRPKNGRMPEPAELGYALRKLKRRVVGGLMFDATPDAASHSLLWSVKGTG